MARMFVVNLQRHLVRPKGALDLLSINELRAGPTLGRIEYDHWPHWPRCVIVIASIGLYVPYLLDHAVHHTRHLLMHLLRLFAFDEIGLPSATTEELLQFLPRDPRKDGWICNLVSVEVQDRQDCSISNRIQEFVGVP